MTIPIWMLLGFSVWTVVVLLFSVGVYRWSQILTGRAEIKEFRADRVEGADWYQRAMRAHMNCVENLPVFAVLVFVLYVTGISSPAVDAMAVTIMVARIFQSVTHIALVQTNVVAAVRFIFFFAQVVCFLGIAATIVQGAGA